MYELSPVAALMVDCIVLKLAVEQNEAIGASWKATEASGEG